MYFYTEPAHLFFLFFFAGKNQRRPQGHNKGSPNVTSNFRGEPTQSDLSNIDRSPQGQRPIDLFIYLSRYQVAN